MHHRNARSREDTSSGRSDSNPSVPWVTYDDFLATLLAETFNQPVPDAGEFFERGDFSYRKASMVERFYWQGQIVEYDPQQTRPGQAAHAPSISRAPVIETNFTTYPRPRTAEEDYYRYTMNQHQDRGRAASDPTSGQGRQASADYFGSWETATADETFNEPVSPEGTLRELVSMGELILGTENLALGTSNDYGGEDEEKDMDDSTSDSDMIVIPPDSPSSFRAARQRESEGREVLPRIPQRGGWVLDYSTADQETPLHFQLSP